MEIRFATSVLKALIPLGVLFTLIFITHPQKSHGLSCGTLFSFSEFIPPQSPTTETIRKAARFIRAQEQDARRDYEFPIDMNPDTWKEVFSKRKPTFWAADHILRSLENFARWVESLEPDLVREAGHSFTLTGELFLSILRKRAAKLGWPEITEAGFHESNKDLVENVISLCRPFVDMWAKDNVHGWLSHFAIWVYVAESLETYAPGSAHQFFDFVTSRLDRWILLDRGPGLRKLTNPAYAWSLLSLAFDNSLASVINGYQFKDPDTGEIIQVGTSSSWPI